MAITREAMKRAVRTGVPDRVTSETSTVPLTWDISTRLPARLASISKRCATDPPMSTSTSTQSPFTFARLPRHDPTRRSRSRPEAPGG